ncbi:MAG TPA: sigma-70 family RNA polymerase sigma factor [Solirubrobacteraceae bacterium]|nr:sigma-70 family RNA polymerase sigma factor [Solirubrobacteraceae bacterium]
MLAARAHQRGARAQLVESFMPLIGSVARIYSRVPAVDRCELMQEGVVGLLRALDRFDSQLGTPFWAYASWWVRQAMQQLVSELSRPVVLSDRALRQLARIRGARRTFVRANGREPSLRELAEESELTVGQLQKLTVADRQPRSLEEPAHERSEGGATFGDLVQDPVAEEAYDDIVAGAELCELPRLLDHASARERAVIEARYGLDGPERTLRELGQRIGVSAERVRQIEEAGLEKMRTALAADSAPSAPRNGHARRRRASQPGRRRSRSAPTGSAGVRPHDAH